MSAPTTERPTPTTERPTPTTERPTSATERSSSTTPRRGSRRFGRAAAAPLTIAALAVAGLPLAATAEADTGERRARAGCLWAGTTYPQDGTVIAGGTSFRCGTDAGAPYWFAGADTDRPATVRTPGATSSPVGQFSPGARQPGTSYTDYCVGNQLIPGTDDVYQVVRLPGDVLLWKAAEPIAGWTFDGTRPAPTWRTASLCIDGVLT